MRWHLLRHHADCIMSFLTRRQPYKAAKTSDCILNSDGEIETQRDFVTFLYSFAFIAITKHHKLDGVNNTNLSLTVPEDGSQRSRCQQVWFPKGKSCLGFYPMLADGHFLTMSSYGHLSACGHSWCLFVFL